MPASPTRPGTSRPYEMQSEPYILDAKSDDLALSEVMGGVTAPFALELPLRLLVVERILI